MQIEQMIIIALLLIQLVLTIYYANYSNYESYVGTTMLPDWKWKPAPQPKK